MSAAHVITGATGLIGSHIAEQLVADGYRVRALVRSTSDTTFLQSLGVELAIASLRDADSVAAELAKGDTLYHCAARVDDSGPWSMFQTEIIDTTRSVLHAAKQAGVSRVVHLSSCAAYGHPDFTKGKVTEDMPLAQNLRLWDYYCQAKAESEAVAREIMPDVAIVRPSWSYGERERSVFPRILRTMRRGKAKLLGSGENLLNLVYAGDVAAGTILAATVPAARGRTYNLASEGEITQRELYDVLAAELDLPPVRRRVPLGIVRRAAFAMEATHRLLHGPRPIITRHGMSLICRPVQYSIERARLELGWQPQMPAVEGIHRMMHWMRKHPELPVMVSAR